MTETVPSKRERLTRMLQQALGELADARALRDTLPRPLYQAALFYCFQHALFLTCKTLKTCLKEEGLSPLTPKQHLEMARQAGWIPPEAEDDWWVLLMAGLQLPEVYETEQANELEVGILSACGRMDELAEQLARRTDPPVG